MTDIETNEHEQTRCGFIALIGIVTTVYSLEGGFEAVIWADVLQAAVMLGGVCIALWYLGAGLDGGLACSRVTGDFCHRAHGGHGEEEGKLTDFDQWIYQSACHHL